MTTTRLALKIAMATDQISPYPTAIQQQDNSQILDNFTLWRSGTLASRPAASVTTPGVYYWVTDTNGIYFNTGTTWQASLQVFAGTEAARPAATFNDRALYRATDSGAIYLSDGTNWTTLVGSRGSSIVSTAQATSSAAYTTLATPDQVSNVNLPTGGLIEVAYQARWTMTSAGSSQAAVFLGANQTQIQGFDGSTRGPLATAAYNLQTSAQVLYSWGGGLASSNSAALYTADASTGQGIGYQNVNGAMGLLLGAASVFFGGGLNDTAGVSAVAQSGPMWIFADAGTYTVSIKFQTSNTITVQDRRLYVKVLPFS